MVFFRLGKWSQIKGTSSPAAAGADEEICPADCQIPPLSWPSVLWSTSVSTAASWDLNNGGHSVCADKPLCCPHMYLHPHSYLHALPHLLLRLHAYILFLLPASSPPPTHPPTRPPLHSCCGSSKPDKVVQPPHLSYPLLSPSTARVLPGAAEEANFPFRADLFHFFSLLIVKSISFSLDSLVLESKTYWFL